MKILITGASSGIGQATAQLLAQKGHDLIITARRENKLKEVALQSKNPLTISYLDISKKDSIDNFVREHSTWLQDIDVLINNAGLALSRDPFQDTHFEDIQMMINTNVTGLLELSRQVLSFMKKRNQGHIINLGSVAADTAYAGGAVYCATKAAVHIYGEALRHDLAGTRIRVSTVAPGRVETDFSLVRFKGDSSQAQKVYEGFKALQPLDVAETIAWILERPSHVNIQEVILYPTEQVSATTVVPFKT